MLPLTADGDGGHDNDSQIRATGLPGQERREVLFGIDHRMIAAAHAALRITHHVFPMTRGADLP